MKDQQRIIACISFWRNSFFLLREKQREQNNCDHQWQQRVLKLLTERIYIVPRLHEECSFSLSLIILVLLLYNSIKPMRCSLYISLVSDTYLLIMLKETVSNNLRISFFLQKLHKICTSYCAKILFFYSQVDYVSESLNSQAIHHLSISRKRRSANKLKWLPQTQFDNNKVST